MTGLDFSKLTKRSVRIATEPRSILAALPARSSKYSRSWDVQKQYGIPGTSDAQNPTYQ
jgi:hypothetical protein